MTISLKVKVQGATKTLQINGDMSIHEVCKEIKERFEGVGGADHGLFSAEQGKWLLPSKIVDFYDLKSGDIVEYKKKHRPLKFMTLDGSVKTAIIDETLPIQQLVDIVCSRIGITNSEEYSFQPETVIPDPKAKKSKNQKVEDQIADDARWLNPDKTLAEHRLGDGDIVILKKKFFFTDQNIDRNDPIQLNLLFNQAKEAILSGKHPCTAEESAQFAAIQCQVQFGNHEPEKHKSGFINNKDFLPPEYQKNKDVAKKIFVEHRKLQGLSDLNAKFRYVQLSRSLKTYGITFFLVKERVEAKKNKLIPALIGVTKSSVVKLDMETKDILKEWKLTQLRRWAASPNSFTLDFGDYAEAYYSVQTTEGDQISQLIAGYIDIILKKRKEAEKVVVEDEVEETSVEEYIKPTKATNFVSVVSNGHRTASESKFVPLAVAPGGIPGQVNGSMASLDERYAQQNFEKQPAYIAEQQALIMAIRNALQMIKGTANDLNQPTNLPPIGNDPAAVAWKEQTIDANTVNIANQIAAQLASSASIMNNAYGPPESLDFELLCSNVASLTTNLSQMCPALKLVAALTDDGDSLLEAALLLVKSTVNLLNSAQMIAVGDSSVRTELHSAGKDLAVDAFDVLLKMGRAEILEDEQLDIENMMTGVVKAVMDLVSNAKSVSKTISDPQAQQNIVSDAKFAFETCQNLNACVSAVVPEINILQCTDQVMEGAVLLRDAIGMLANSCGISTNMEAVDSLMDAAQRVEEAIARLIEKASKAGTKSGAGDSELDGFYDIVISSSDKMLENSYEMEGIILNTKALTLASTQFVSALKKTANGLVDDEDERVRLISSAKNLAEATSKMVSAAKDTARATNDLNKQENLKKSIEELKKAANVAAGPQIRDRALYKLGKAVKEVIASSNQLSSSSKAAAPTNRNQAAQLQLNLACKKVNESLPPVISALKSFQSNPQDIVCQTKLIQASKQCLIPGNSAVSAARIAVSSVGDSVSQTQLMSTASHNEENLIILDKILRLVDELNSEVQIENALLSIKSIQKDLVVSQSTAFIGQSALSESNQFDLFSVASAIQGTISQLAEAAARGNEKQSAVVATDAVMALQALSIAVQGFAATEEDANFRQQLLNATSGVGDTLGALIGAVKIMADGGGSSQLKSLANDASLAIGNVVDCFPGQRDLESAIVRIGDIVDRLGDISSNKTAQEKASLIKESRINLQQAATKMTNASDNILSVGKGSAEEVKEGSESFVEAFKTLVATTYNFGSNVDDQISGKLTIVLQEVGYASTTLLQSTKKVAIDFENKDYRDQLHDSAKLISDAMNSLLEICSALSIGHAECNNAHQIISLTSAKFDASSSESGSNQDSYGDCLIKLTEKSKIAVGAVGALNTLARGGDMAKLSNKLVEAANVISSISEVSARAAYLVGISDPTSIPASPGPLDRHSISQCVKDVKDSCKSLIDPKNTQKEILETAGIIAKNTSILCGICKTAGQNTAVSGSSRKRCLDLAKEMADATASLATSIKQLAMSRNESCRSDCKEDCSPLVKLTEDVLNLSYSPEFAGTPAKIGVNGFALQKPIVMAQNSLLSSAESAVNIIKLVCSSPDDEDLFKQLGQSVKGVTDSLQAVAKIVIRSIPGAKETEEAISKVTESTSAIDQALVESNINNLEPTNGIEKEAVVFAIHAFTSLIDIINKVAKTDPGQLGNSLIEIPTSFHYIVLNSIATASQSPDLTIQSKILEDTKESTDSLSEFLYAIKNSLVGTKAVDHAKKIESEKLKLKTSLNKLCSTIEGSSADNSEMAKAIERIEFLLSSDNGNTAAPKQSYQDYCALIEKYGKTAVETVGDILSKTKTMEQYRLQGLKMSEICENISPIVTFATMLAEDPKVKESLSSSFRDFAATVIRLFEAMRLASGKSSADQASRAKLSQSAREVSVAVSSIIAAAKDGSKGLIVCQESISNINDMIGDLDSVYIFAQAGQLEPVDPKDNFLRHKDSMMSSAKTLIEQVKGFITAVSGSQDELAVLSVASVNTLLILKDIVKKGATSITSADNNMQLHLLSAAKTVAESLQLLIATSMSASGKSNQDPTIVAFSDAVKKEFGAVAELVRLAKVLSDESLRGARALEVAIKDIDEAIEELRSDKPAYGTSLPEEVATLAKLLATAAASIVTLSGKEGKQDEMVASSNLIKKQIQDLCRAGKAVTANAPEDHKDQMIEAVSKSSISTQALLKLIKQSREGGDMALIKLHIQAAAKTVALAVSEIVGASSNLIPAGYVDMSDPNVVAERELLAAASSIEQAAKILSSFKPVDSPDKTIEDLSFEGQILEAAKSIAMASSALVKSATSVQREIVAGNIIPADTTEKMYFNDGTWSNGLVSAAKSVAAATRDLCESASDVMKGDVHRDRLVVAARNVSSSTTQLLSAAVVRADRLSQNQVRLKAAGKAVTNATQLLVKACDESIAFNDTEAISDVLDGKTATAAKVLEMEAQMSILKMEKELERARNKLATVRKNKYDKSGDRHSTGSDLNLDQDSGSQEIFKAKTASSDRNSAPPLKPTSAGGFFRKSKN